MRSSLVSIASVSAFLVVTAVDVRHVDAACVRPDCVTSGANVAVGGTDEASIAINPTDPTNLITSFNFGIAPSFDGGLTWAPFFPPPFSSQLVDPNVGFDTQGNAYWQGLSIASDPRTIGVAKSVNGGQTWSSPVVFYAPTTGNGNPDQGFMAVDTHPSSPFKDNVYVIFSDYPVNPQPGRIGFSLMFARSTDGAQSFSTPIDISDSSSGGQESSSSITTGPNGEIYVVWYDLGGNVRFDSSLDGGVTWGVDKLVRAGQPQINNFPLTDDVRGNPTVVVDRTDGPFSGTIYVSSIDVNGPSGGAADAWVVRSTDAGNTWSSSVLLSDGPRGAYKYYFQPRIAVAPNGRLDAAWYDTRLNMSTDTNSVTYDIFYTYSLDGGATVAPNLRVTDVSAIKMTNCAQQGPCGDRRLYEYIGLASDTDRALAVWTDLRTGSERITTARVTIPTALQPCVSPVSGKSRLTLRAPGTEKAQLIWRFVADPAISKTTFGDPLTTTDYALQIFDESGGMPTEQLTASAPADGMCDGQACWRESTTGFTYKDRDLTPDGLLNVKLRTGAAGKGKITIKGRGLNLNLSSLPLTLPVTVQLTTDGGACFHATFTEARRNDTVKFTATSD